MEHISRSALLAVCMLASCMLMTSQGARLLHDDAVRPRVMEDGSEGYSYVDIDGLHDAQEVHPAREHELWARADELLMRAGGLYGNDGSDDYGYNGKGGADEETAEYIQQVVTLYHEVISGQIIHNQQFQEAFIEALTAKLPEIIPNIDENDYDTYDANVLQTTESPDDDGGELFSETCQRDMDRLLQPITHPLGMLGYDLIYCAEPIPRPRLVFCNNRARERVQEELFYGVNITGWGFDMLDATGKPGYSILRGNIHWVGDHDWCNVIKGSYNTTGIGGEDDIQHNIQGQYCRIAIAPVNASLPLNLALNWGLCLVDTCTEQEVVNYLMRGDVTSAVLLSTLNMRVRSSFCGHDEAISDSAGSVIAATIVVMIILVVAAATVYDVFVRQHIYSKRMPRDTIAIHKDQDEAIYNSPDLQVNIKANGVDTQISTISGSKNNFLHHQASRESITKDGKIVEAEVDLEPITPLQRIEVLFVGFSAYTNLKHMFRHKRPSGWMASIDGLRVLSAIWVLFGYSFILGTLYSEAITTVNVIPKLLEWLKTGWFQLVVNFHFAGDTFLVLGGVLVTFWWFKDYEKHGNRITWWMLVRFYLHRYWRLMPTLMIVVMVYGNMYKFLTEGPLCPPEITDAENCLDNWWINFLMLQNLIKKDVACISWSWTTAVAFQVHVFTPLVLIPLTLWPLVGLAVWGFMFVVYLVSSFVAVTEALPEGFANPQILAFYYDVIRVPWCRSIGHLVGILVGYFLVKYKKQLHLPTPIAVLGWFIGLGLFALPVFITHEMFNNELWNEEETACFLVLGRIAFCLSIAWIIIACETGNGGGVYSFLRWGAWRGLAPIMYSMMVLTPILIFKNVYGKRQTMYLEILNMVYHWTGNTFTIFCIALGVSLAIEHPTRNMSRAIFSKTKDEAIMAGNHKKLPYEAH